jgi:Cu+-exporting ATPase
MANAPQEHYHGHHEGIIEDESWETHRIAETGLSLEDRRVMVAFLLVQALILVANWFDVPKQIDLTPFALFIGAPPLFIQAARAIKSGRLLSVEVLVSIAVSAAVSQAMWFAAATITLIIEVGIVLEELIIDRSRKSILSLVTITPDTARVRRAEGEVVVEARAVAVGERVLVKPGEKIPVDGIIRVGESSVDQAPLTGEFMPVVKRTGEMVFAGTINQLGVLEVEVTKKGEQTMVAAIVRLVRQAIASKAEVTRYIDEITQWLMPAALLLALWAYFFIEVKVAITVLVLACPCALILATPTAFVAALGNAAKRGMLIKGGAVMERAARVDCIVLDKTGTITFGVHRVEEVIPFGGKNKEDVLATAALAEKFSEHPLGKAICREAERRGMRVPDPTGFKLKLGLGVTAESQGQRLLVGNERLLAEYGIAVPEDAKKVIAAKGAEGQTVSLVARDDRVLGAVVFFDTIKADVKETIQELEKLGIRRIEIMTGDIRPIAKTIARAVGIAEQQVHAEMSPEAKVERVKQLQQEGYVVAMVGDGINDAPSLAKADLGIAMAAVENAVAIEVADVVLLSQDFKKLVDVIKLSRVTKDVIRLNTWFSLAIAFISIYFGMRHYIKPVGAALIHQGSSLAVVLSSARLLTFQMPKEAPAAAEEPLRPATQVVRA